MIENEKLYRLIKHDDRKYEDDIRFAMESC